MMSDHGAEGPIGPIVAIWSGQGDVPQHRGTESIGIFQSVAFTHSTHITGIGIEQPGSSRSDMWQGQGMESVVRKQSSIVAGAAPGLSEKELHSPNLLGAKGIRVAGEKAVIGAVEATEFGVHEIRQCIGNMLDLDTLPRRDIRKGFPQQLRIFRNGSDPMCDQPPTLPEPPAGRLGNLVFLSLARHFELGGHGKQRLRRENTRDTAGKVLGRWRVKTVAVKV